MKAFLFLVPTLSSGADVSANVFSLADATKFAWLSKLSYCGEDDELKYCGDAQSIRDWTCTGCLDSQVYVVPGSVHIVNGGTFDAGQVLYGAYADQPGCFVAWRGSSNLWNWVRDLELFPTRDKRILADCDGCQVHSGFDTLWNNMRDLLLSGLKDIGCSPGGNNELHMTGHSLGAAVATLASFDLHMNGFNITKIYSFESPRLGNDKFADAFNSMFGGDFPSFRITHHRDPVVHLPPEAFGFFHVNTEVFFDGETADYEVCKGSEDGKCSNKYSNVPIDMFYVSDHSSNSAFGPSFVFAPLNGTTFAGDAQDNVVSDIVV